MQYIVSFLWLFFTYTAKKNLLKKPLQKIVTGGIVLSLAFFTSSFVQYKLVENQPTPIPNGKANISISKPENCALEGYFSTSEVLSNNFSIDGE